MPEYKTISDTVHGTLRIEGVVLDLLETLEVQRLNGIRQLGLAYLVFPGANHTRVEHVLGTSHVAGEMARALQLAREEREMVEAAALLHDVGHGPFSHTLEHVLAGRTGQDHMHITQRVIEGDLDTAGEAARAAFPDVPPVVDVLEKHGLDPAAVAELVRGCGPLETLLAPGPPSGPKRYLAQLIHGPVDADQVDYLLRDAHYTGVAHGMIDHARLVQTLAVHRGELAVDRKGLAAVEGMLVARALMYSAVYFHKTVRIAELMLSRAVERTEGDIAAVQRMTDAELLAWLLEQGAYPKDIVLRLRHRRLFKRAYAAGPEELTAPQREALSALSDEGKRRRVEDAVADRAGIPPGYVVVDVPAPELLLTEPRMAQLDLPILDEGKALPFPKASPLGRALRVRDVADWAVMVAAEGRYREPAAKAAEKVLFG